MGRDSEAVLRRGVKAFGFVFISDSSSDILRTPDANPLCDRKHRGTVIRLTSDAVVLDEKPRKIDEERCMLACGSRKQRVHRS